MNGRRDLPEMWVLELRQRLPRKTLPAMKPTGTAGGDV